MRLLSNSYRFGFSGLLLFLLLSVDIYANTQQPQFPRESPAEILENAINNVFTFLSEQQTVDDAQIAYYVINEIAPNFDLEYMARWVAGRYYRLMKPEQQQQFTREFSQIFISRFVEKIGQNRYNLPRIRRFTSRQTARNEAIATAIFAYSDRPDIRVDFRFMLGRKGWKVVDVKANGISALMYFRQYFSQIMRQRLLRQQYVR